MAAMGWSAYGITQQGSGRVTNEDAILYPPERVRLASGGECLVMAVADGVGGVYGGEVASSVAIQSLRRNCKRAIVSHPAGMLRWLFDESNERVRDLRPKSGRQGPATTLVVAAATERSIWIGNVGDSRAYLLRGRTVTQVTEDHVDRPLRSEGHVTPVRFLTRALGVGENVEVDVIGPIDVSPDDWLVLCSDGLHDLLDQEELAAIVRGGGLQAAAQALLQRAIEIGSADDISIVLAAVNPNRT